MNRRGMELIFNFVVEWSLVIDFIIIFFINIELPLECRLHHVKLAKAGQFDKLDFYLFQDGKYIILKLGFSFCLPGFWVLNINSF